VTDVSQQVQLFFRRYEPDQVRRVRRSRHLSIIRCTPEQGEVYLLQGTMDLTGGICRTLSLRPAQEIGMNEETFNLSIRKFLKMVGVSSQREIEHAVAKALADGTLKGSALPATMTLDIPGLKLNLKFDSEINLD
jgi:hypothetical protein